MVPSMTRAFVLSGGASLGAVQVGMLRALAERGILPDLVVGASAGAINAAWVAGDPRLEDLDGLEQVWLGLRTRDVFPAHPVRGLLGFLGRRSSLVSNHALRALLRRHVRFDRLEDAPIPISVIATEVLTGIEAVLDRGSTVDALLASSAIPGVLPPVTIDGRALIDGSIVNNVPISEAVDNGATEVWVLSTGYACNLAAPPSSALAMTLHALSLLIDQRLIRDVQHFQGSIDLRVIPPLCPLTVSPADFSQARSLMDRSYEAARTWIDHLDTHVAADQSRDLGFHRH
jgi:NTE family protein